MEKDIPFVVFAMEGQKFALHLSAVERVIRAVAVTPLPQSAPVVWGIIDIGGRVVAVMDIRQCFGMPRRQIRPQDHFIIANSARHCLVLVVDQVEGICYIPEKQITPGTEIVSPIKYVEAVASVATEMIVIHDLDTLLSRQEEEELTRLLAQIPPEVGGDGSGRSFG